MIRACLIIAVASGTRIYDKASDLKADGKEADSFLPQVPIAKLGGHPPVGIPFGANPAKPGERSSWRYSLFKEVRHGPFGPTWKAFDTKRVREVDLSVYSDKGLGGELQDESREECLKLQKLIAGESKFPMGKEHICQCLESRWSEYDGAYLVMEDCGETLTEKLREQWRHPEEDFLATARGWMKQGLEAVAFLSGLEGPMGHLRLRMNNIMVNDKGDLKLVDFSWAKPSEDPNKPWSNDVYSLGAIYYELLCRSVAEDKPFAEALLRQGEEPTCRDGSLGIGTEKDWEVIKFAVADYEQRKSPQELLKMLDKAR